MQERISAAIRLWFFYTHMSLCTLCPGTMLCYRNHSVPWHGQYNLASLPAALCHSPTHHETFFNASEISFVSGQSTQCRGGRNDLNCPAELQKEKQFISCCSVTKGKTARDIALFPFPEGEAFVSYWQWGADTKSLLSLKGMAWMYCLNIHYVNATLNSRSSFLLSPPPSLQIWKPCLLHFGHDIALNGEKCVLMPVIHLVIHLYGSESKVLLD